MPKTSTAALRRLMDELPFNSHLGLKLKRRHEDGVTIECPIRPEFFNIHKTLHGGVTATLVDLAAGFGTLSHYGRRPCATVEMKLSYFLPLTGRDVFDEKGRLAGAGMITYMLLNPTPALPHP